MTLQTGRDGEGYSSGQTVAKRDVPNPPHGDLVLVRGVHNQDWTVDGMWSLFLQRAS